MKRRFRTGALVVVALAATAWSEARPLAAQTGSIEVSVSVPPARPARRTPPGAYQRQRARAQQDIPPLVYLEGVIAGAPAERGGGPVSMVQKDTLFAPPALFVPVGQTVDFPNDDPFYHNVFSYSPTQRFDLGRYSSGESKQVTFTTPGLVDVFCEVHEHMRAVIFVTENPFYSELGEDERVRFAGVPPGTYTVVVWHPEFRPTREEVTVGVEGTARIEVELSR